MKALLSLANIIFNVGASPSPETLPPKNIARVSTPPCRHPLMQQSSIVHEPINAHDSNRAGNNSPTRAHCFGLKDPCSVAALHPKSLNDMWNGSEGETFSSPRFREFLRNWDPQVVEVRLSGSSKSRLSWKIRLEAPSLSNVLFLVS
jgi:hypothetical protein